MADNYGALCSDFFINQRLNLKMDLPTERETVMGLFDRVRREHPSMDRFRRFPTELVLESDPHADSHQWIALKKNSVRTGVVNPATPGAGYALHQLTLDVAPYFLSISPLDVEYLEVLYGFDLLASGNHDAIVFDALIAPTPLGKMLDFPGARPLDCRPILGVALDDEAQLQATVEVKTRSPGGAGSPAWRGEPSELPPEPITVFLILRRLGPVADVGELKTIFTTLTRHAERILQNKVIPNLLVPIREAIASNS